MATSLRSFASTDRFLTEIAQPSSLRPGYALIGDEIFLYDRCRRSVLSTLVPEGARDFALHDIDLAETSIFDALDRAQTPSLMAPFQVLFIRNLKVLYGRGSKKEEFAAIDAYFRSPNPQALLLFVADHIRIPTDIRRMDYQDKERFDRIRETLGDWCGIVELARVDENDAVRWITDTAESRGVRFDPDAARELADSLGADMMLISSEFEKLLLYVTAPSSLAPTGVISIATHPTPVIPSEAQSAESRNPRISPKAPGLSAEAPISAIVTSIAAGAAERSASPPAQPITKNRVTLGDVETMVLAAKQRSLYELTDAISAKDRARALALLHGLLNASDGGEDAAIGHLYMLARTFRQMLVILEKNVRDSRAIWQALWQGFRMPPFAAEDLIRQARRYKSRRELTRALRLVARADIELRSSPVSKVLVLERLILDLCAEPKSPLYEPSTQFAMEL